MAGPTIVISQGASTTTGVPNLNILTGSAVTFSLTSSFGAYQWQLVSRPVNHSLVESSDILSVPSTNPTITITPTSKGTYKIRFIADNGVGVNKISELWFYARNSGDPLVASTATLPRRHVAYTEGSETGTRGAMTELDAWLFVIEDIWNVTLNSSVGTGGDLSGPLNAATVVGLRGRPVSSASPSAGDALEWNGAAWAPAEPSGDIFGPLSAIVVTGLQGHPVSSTAPTSSQVLQWNGSAWTPGSVAGGSLGGDVTGPEGTNTVVKLQNRSLDNAAPSSGNVLTWDGSKWTPVAPAGGVLPLIIPFPGVAGIQATSGTNAYRGIGAIVFDPSALAVGTRVIKFRVVIEALPGVTAQIKLFNLDDGEDVTGTTLSTSANTATRLLSSSLTVGSSTGNIKNALRTYEVRLQVFTPNPASTDNGCTCKLAQLEVNYT